MFTSFSWWDFFSATAVVLGIYYFLSILLLYRNTYCSFFKRGKISDMLSNKEQSDSNELHELMGDVRYEPNPHQMIQHKALVNADTLIVADSPAEEEEIVVVDLEAEALRNDFTILSREIQPLLELAYPSGKEASIPLFKTLLSNYTHFVGTSYQEKISLLIFNSCQQADQHLFSLQEIHSWWTDSDHAV